MIDVAYIIRPGHRNEELRHSLRSLANVPHGDVWIAGHRPAWVSESVRHIFVPQRDPGQFKYENATSNLLALAAEGPERFALMNDDIFCMEPVDDWPGPAHRGSLHELAATRPGAYGSMLRTTAALLTEAGIPVPLAYTLHAPMVMTQQGLRTTLDYGLSRRVGEERLSWRSLYGNLMRLGGPIQEDAKVHAGEPPASRPWISTTDASFKYHVVGRLIRSRFSQPSPYEMP